MAERIDIVVTAQGAVTVRREIADIGTAATQAAKPVDQLSRVLKTVITAAAVQQLFKYADAYTNINNRLKLVSASTGELRATQAALFQQAQNSYTSYEQLVQIYSRTAQALIPLGKSTQDVLAFTDLLSKSVALSGVSAASASAALVQLSQGMASGTLRGEELNSVLEQLPYVAQTIANGMGVAVGALRQLAMDGVITPQVILDAYAKMGKSINADFATLVPTISMGFQKIQNALIEVVGSTNATTGVFTVLAYTLSFVADNMTILSYAAVPLLAALTAIGAAYVLGALVTGFGLLSTALGFVAVGINAVTLAIISNPLFLGAAVIIAGLAAVIAAMYQFADTFRPIIDWLDALWAKFVSVMNAIRTALAELGIIQNGTIDIELKGITAAKDLKGAVSDGGADAAKKLKDALGKGGDELAKKTEKAIDTGSKKGGDIIGNGIQNGAKEAAKSLEEAVVDGTAKGIQTGISGLTTLFDVWMQKFRNDLNNVAADSNLKNAQAQEALANAAKAKAEASAARGIGYGNNNSGSGMAFAKGGSFMVGGNGGTDSQSVQFRASPNERVTVETPAQQKASDSNSSPVIDNKTTIVNSFDPAAMGAFLQTAAGARVIRNVVQADVGTYRKILGS